MNSSPRLLRLLPTLILAAVGLFTVVYFVGTHEGLYALDDYFYSRYAYQLLHGTFALGPDPQRLLHDPLHERWLIFGPVAAAYALFGVNIWSTTLWPLVATLACLALLWATYRRPQPAVAAGALLLLGLHYFTLNLTNYLYPDNVNMLACAAAALALRQARRGRREVAWGVAFAGLNMAALLCKETVVYYGPFYLLLLVLDLRQSRHRTFWLTAAGTGALLLAAYLGFYHWQTGDALYRVHLIERTNEVLQDGNFMLGNRAALFDRLTLGPLRFLIGTGLGLAVVLAVGGLWSASAATDDRRFWQGLAFSTLAFYWLGSTSLTYYNPITLLPRMTTPLLPPLCVAAAFGLADVLRTGRRTWLYVIALLALAAFDRGAAAVLYAGSAAVLAGLRLAGQRRVLPTGSARYVGLGLFGLGVVLALRPAHFLFKPRVSGHFPQARVIDAYLQAPLRGTVFVDDYLISNFDFYYGYQVPAGLQYRRYWARDSVNRGAAHPTWLLLNRATLSNPELTRQLLRYSPDSALGWFPQRRLVAQDGPVELYQVMLPKR